MVPSPADSPDRAIRRRTAAHPVRGKGLETGATEGKPTEGKPTEGKGADAVPERGMHELVAHVLSQLGTMELIGLITVENGRISIVPETGGRRRS